MKQYIIAILLVLQASFLFAQQERKYLRQGDQLYQQKKYKEAEAAYRQAMSKKAKTLEGNFNLGDAMFKQKNMMMPPHSSINWQLHLLIKM
ncbi:tetratricopeptide repeat protein [Mucilaginibacter sp. P25]|uniref:tetratricopeptide repeat protein n=1 Tax=Mucilaginibacter sp. P25 TaxID=3423945 RepID=UPI003D796264